MTSRKKVSFSNRVKTIRVPRSSPNDHHKLYYHRDEIEQFRIEKRRRRKDKFVLSDFIERYIDSWTCIPWVDWRTSKYLVPMMVWSRKVGRDSIGIEHTSNNWFFSCKSYRDVTNWKSEIWILQLTKPYEMSLSNRLLYINKLLQNIKLLLFNIHHYPIQKLLRFRLMPIYTVISNNLKAKMNNVNFIICVKEIEEVEKLGI